MIVFCNAIVFFVSPLLNRNKEKNNQVKTLFLSCGGISCVFMMFIIGNSVLWAVATLAFAVVTIKIAEPIITTIWQKRVLEIQSDKQNAQIIINGIANLSSSLRSPILGCLLQVMGFVGTCFCCGALGTVGTVVFSRVFKKHKAFKAK